MIGSVTVAAPSQSPLSSSIPIIPPAPTKSANPLSRGDQLVLSTPRREPFNVIEAGKKNTTQGYTKANMPVSIKQALEPTLRLIDAVEPELAKGIRNLDENDFALSDNGIGTFLGRHEIYAAWVAVAREGWSKLHVSDMVLDNHFWELRDAEKASVLIHEYVHAKEIPIVSHFQKLYGSISNLIKKDYGDPVEDRAYLRQLQTFPKLGIHQGDTMYWEVRTYLEDRGLWKAS